MDGDVMVMQTHTESLCFVGYNFEFSFAGSAEQGYESCYRQAISVAEMTSRIRFTFILQFSFRGDILYS